MSVNNVVIVGRLTRDADLRYTPNGAGVANFTVASNRPFKNADGENEADFINCVIWRKAAENLANYTSKGSLIAVTGRLQSRRYDDKDGKTVFVTEVVADSVQFLDTKGSQSNKQHDDNQSNKGSEQKKQEHEPFPTDGEPIDIEESDLPF